jgi:hypothetical protein
MLPLLRVQSSEPRIGKYFPAGRVVFAPLTSRPTHLSLGKNSFQQITHAQVGGHAAHVGAVKPVALHLEHAQHVAPLAVGSLTAQPIPFH